jgi:hypothetical protein
MTSWTVGPLRSFCHEAASTQRVLPVRYRLQVLRVAARWHPAQMVGFEAFGDRAYVKLI